ncbi:MAG TPA: oligosaccharide flippase family protein [Chitinispirillaceae bacterium]|nr:oligosaccharide flippase family protein [Chitinispirillaceae bacterium]
MFDEKSLGLFSFSYDMSILPQVVINAVLGNITVSMFSRLQNNRSGTENGFVHLTFVTSAMVIPVLLSMSLLSEEIVHTICFFKKNTIWVESSVLMRWLSLMGIFYAISVFPSTIWISNKRIVPSILWSCTMFLTTVAAIFSAIKWGIEGIAIALFIRSAVVFPLFVYINFRITGIKSMAYLKSIYPAFASGVLVIIPVFAIKNLIPGISLFRDVAVLLVSALAGGGIYIFLLRFFSGSLLDPLTDMLRGVKRKVSFFYR